MEAKRKDDLKTRTHFRSDRVFARSGNWYFSTREGTIEGPFDDQLEARRRVEIYIMMIVSRLVGKLS